MPPSHLAVHGLPVADIGEVDDEPTYLVQRRPRFFQQHGDVGHRLLGLLPGVADVKRLSGLEVLGDLTPQEHHRAAGHYDLAEVVVEVLFGVGVPRVEGTESLVGHGGRASSVVRIRVQPVGIMPRPWPGRWLRCRPRTGWSLRGHPWPRIRCRAPVGRAARRTGRRGNAG